MRLPLLSFNSIQELYLNGYFKKFNPSIFPALKTLAVERDSLPQRTLSTLFSSPESLPSLKTLVFLGCGLSEAFMESLAQFAFERKNTAFASLGRVVIVHENREPLNAESIRTVERHVSVVDVRPSGGMPEDLKWCREGGD